MTLGTHIRTTAPANPKALLDFLTVLVEGDPATAVRRERPGYIANQLGQGFAAIVEIHYGLDGPLQMEGFDYGGEFHDEADGPFVPAPAAAVCAELDTAYGYKGPDGETCSQLHLRLATAVAGWVRERHPDADVWWWMDTHDEWWKFDREAVTSGAH